MSKLINKVDNRLEYIDILTAEEIEEARQFLEKLQYEVNQFEQQLSKTLSSSTIEYRYKIGEFLDKQIRENNISSKERIYVWNEIRDLTESDIKVAIDRGKRREFYEYCYRIYQFGEELAYAFTWSQWVDILDRSAALKDERFVTWLSKTEYKINTDNLRMLLLILTMYLEKRDLSVFDDDEVQIKFDFLFTIVIQWNDLFKKYFSSKKSNLSDARREKFTKYKKKYISDVLTNSKFATIEMLPSICEDAFKKYFVDIDTSGNFKK
ncbi:MAG: hypothetical protein SO206_03865 [Bacilli bacterium]|nr:hypothetical protein [Bacilli bacterium]